MSDSPHSYWIFSFSLLILPTGNLEVQSSRTGKRENEGERGRGGGKEGGGRNKEKEYYTEC